MFDQIRIAKIRVTIYPRTNFSGFDVGTADWTNQAVPNMYSCIDYDNTDPLMSFAALAQYTNFRMSQGRKPHVRAFRPCWRLDYGKLTRGFIDMANAAEVRWRGMHLLVDVGPETGQAFHCLMKQEFWIQCRGNR